jgi:two-component sensor histidine kinase
LAFQTARTSRDYDEFQKRFADRLDALASAHDLLTRESWEGAELGALLDEVLRPYMADGARITASGPQVSLSPNAAVTTTLALHELATNALKHGALADQEGRVDVRWSLQSDALAFEWRESGVRELKPRDNDGFGARLLKAAARELDAVAQTEFGPDGLIHRWRVPLSSKVRPAA